MGSRRLVTSPAFQFYPQDWLVGTQGMSLAAKGAYVQIIAFGWLKGPLTFDLNELAKLIGCARAELDAVWPEVLPKLRQTKRGFTNRRVEQERGELRRFRETKRQAANTRWRKEKAPPQQPPVEVADDFAASQAEYAENPPSVEPVFVNPKYLGVMTENGFTPAGGGSTVIGELVTSTPSGNPHHKPTNLINGASLRRHGSHAWCSPRDGLCVPQFLHEEFLGKSNKPHADLLAWYASTIAALNGHAVGEDALVFWRNSFAGWVGTVTASPDNNSRQARNNAGARELLEEIHSGKRKSITQVVRELAARPAIAAKPS